MKCRTREVAFAAMVGAVVLIIVVLIYLAGSEKHLLPPDEDGYILKPYTEVELQQVIHAGMTRKQLSALFGRPRESHKLSMEQDTLDFWFAHPNFRDSADYALLSFQVILSNDVVIGWEPGMHMSVGYSANPTSRIAGQVPTNSARECSRPR